MSSQDNQGCRKHARVAAELKQKFSEPANGRPRLGDSIAIGLHAPLSDGLGLSRLKEHRAMNLNPNPTASLVFVPTELQTGLHAVVEVATLRQFKMTSANWD